MSRQRKYRPGHGHARRRSLRLTRRPSASVSRAPGSRTRTPDRWPSCHARHCAAGAAGNDQQPRSSRSGELVFEWYSAGAFHTETSSGAALGSRLGEFQQVAVVVSETTVTFYVNGAAVGSSTSSAPVPGGVAGNLEIGGLADGPNLFNGLIDDLSITITPLPAAEIAQIYANGGVGTDLGGSGTEDTTVAGNFIGTDPTGTIAVANGGDGVEINGAFNNTIGGTVAGAGNLISGNGNGVEINDASSNFVQGNLIGTDWTGHAPDWQHRGRRAGRRGLVVQYDRRAGGRRPQRDLGQRRRDRDHGHDDDRHRHRRQPDRHRHHGPAVLGQLGRGRDGLGRIGHDDRRH